MEVNLMMLEGGQHVKVQNVLGQDWLVQEHYSLEDAQQKLHQVQLEEAILEQVDLEGDQLEEVLGTDWH